MSNLVIDIHSHTYPVRFANYLRDRAMPPYVRSDAGVERFKLFPGDCGVPFTEDFLDVAAKLTFMKAAGIGHSVLSVGNPWLDLDPGEATVDLAMGINQDLLDMIDHDADKLAALCVMPNHDPKSAADAIRRLGTDRRCVGFASGTEICGRTFDDPGLEPIWTALSELALPLFVHPREGLAGRASQGYGQVLTIALDFPFATTVALARLLMSGVAVRHPGLRVVAAHGGGTLPYLLGRIRRAASVEDRDFGFSVDDLLASARSSIFVDAVVYSAGSLRQAIDVVGQHNVMFGSDHPFPIEDATSELRTITELSDVDSAAMHGVLGDNAAALFGLGSS